MPVAEAGVVHEDDVDAVDKAVEKADLVVMKLKRKGKGNEGERVSVFFLLLHSPKP